MRFFIVFSLWRNSSRFVTSSSLSLEKICADSTSGELRQSLPSDVILRYRDVLRSFCRGGQFCRIWEAIHRHRLSPSDVT